MIRFRYNPFLGQWVMVRIARSGQPGPLRIPEGSFSKDPLPKGWRLAPHPDSFNLLERESVATRDLAYREEPAAGEHDLIIWNGHPLFPHWRPWHWVEWLQIVGSRMVRYRLEPDLSAAIAWFDTGTIDDVNGGQLMGEVAAYSKPLHNYRFPETGMLAAIRREEPDLVVLDSDRGFLYVVPASLTPGELMWIPTESQGSFIRANKHDYKRLAEALTKVFPALERLFPRQHFLLELINNPEPDLHHVGWYVRIVPQVVWPATQPKPLPEYTAAQLRKIL